MNERLLTKPGDWELEKHTVKEVPLDFDVINPTMKFSGFNLGSRIFLLLIAITLLFVQGEFHNIFSILMIGLMLWGLSLYSIAMNIESDECNFSEYSVDEDDDDTSIRTETPGVYDGSWSTGRDF